MNVQHVCRQAAQLALFTSIVTSASQSMAQAPFRTITAGAEFNLKGLKGHADDVPGGRRFRAGAFEEITVRAPIHLPASSAADHKLQQLIIRFRTSDRGPRLIHAELLGGSRVLHSDNEVDISGDYSKRETATPPRAANVLNMGGISVGSDTVVQLTLSFGGGFDSVVDNGDFVLLAVEATFPLRPKNGESTVSSTRVDSLAALSEPVKSIGRVPSAPGTARPARSICESARDARARNSPAAPNLEAQCRAVGERPSLSPTVPAVQSPLSDCSLIFAPDQAFDIGIFDTVKKETNWETGLGFTMLARTEERRSQLPGRFIPPSADEPPDRGRGFIPPSRDQPAARGRGGRGRGSIGPSPINSYNARLIAPGSQNDRDSGLAHLSVTGTEFALSDPDSSAPFITGSCTEQGVVNARMWSTPTIDISIRPQ